jgi:hypothetical protein
LQLPREWIGLALVILGIARAALLVGHDPVVGYANQYDMIRTSACLGLFPALPEPQRYEAHPEAPLPRYKVEAVRPDICYPSSEIIVAAVTVSLTRAMGIASDGVKLQWIGFAKLGLLAATALVIAWTLHRHPPAALLHGIIIFALLCDPMVTLWFNSLYTEFAVTWALYAVIAAITALAITERGAIPLTLVLISALGALAFSREQFALLAPFLVVLSWPWLWQRSPHLTVAAFGVALIASLIAFELVPHPPTVKMVNRADTYLGLVVPAASDTKRAMETLGLPEHCEPLVGASWYLQRGETLTDACPEVLKLSSVAFLKVAAVEPEIMPRSLARVLPATQELSPPYLGVLEGGKGVQVNELPWWLASPLHAIVWRLPLFAYVTMVLAVIAAVPLAFLGALGWARPSRTQHGTELLLAMLLGGVATYALVTTTFGDGLSEAARHFIPGSLAVYAAWIALFFALPSLLMRWIAAPKAGILEMVAAVVAVIAIGFACRVSINWAGAQPLALGTLDNPPSRFVAPGAPLVLEGWAIDPAGIASVTVEAGTLRREAKLDGNSPRLKRSFPGYPDSDAAGYSLTLSPEDLTKAGAPDPVTLRILAKSRAGPTLEIDRRRLEFRAP